MAIVRFVVMLAVWVVLFYGAYKLWRITLRMRVQDDASRVRRTAQRVAKTALGAVAAVLSLAVAWAR